MTKSVSQGLIEARDLIAKGWKTGGYEDHRGPNGGARYCIRGAIGEAFFGDYMGSLVTHRGPAYEAEKILQQVLHLPAGSSRINLEMWNDDTGFFMPKWLKHRCVLRAFDKAIKEARRREVEALKKVFVPIAQLTISAERLVDPVFDAEIVAAEKEPAHV